MYRAVVVDDEPYMRDGMRTLIDWEGCGFTLVGEAPDGEAALQLLALKRPDLMICDVRMPVMQGTELAIRARELYPHMVIVFISGHRDFSYAQAAIRVQAFCYLLKPIDADEIHTRLREIAAHLSSAFVAAPPVAAARMPSAAADRAENLEALWGYIEKHYHRNPSLSELAAQLHLHKGYLGQWIKRETGQTFHTHVTHRRIREAQRLLRQSDLSIKQIAAGVGIGDVDYFSAQFRIIVGQTPMQFRRR